jgi:hypothetical protein
MSDDVKDEYDFSKAERGRFFRRSAVLVPPIQPKEESEVLPEGNVYGTE